MTEKKSTDTLESARKLLDHLPDPINDELKASLSRVQKGISTEYEINEFLNKHKPIHLWLEKERLPESKHDFPIPKWVCPVNPHDDWRLVFVEGEDPPICSQHKVEMLLSERGELESGKSIYNDGISGERTENIERAIFHYQQSLQILSRAANPELWAQIQYSLGKAYASRIKGNRTANFDRAIQYFQNALEIYTRETFPEQWARAQLYLGEAYSALAGDSTTDAPPPPKKKKDK